MPNIEPPEWRMPAFHPTYVRMLCALLRKRGVDVAALLAGTGLSLAGLADSDTPVSYAQVHRLLAAAARLGAAPGLGLEVARNTPVMAHGPVGYAAVASRDVAQALEVICTFGALRCGVLSWRLTRFDSHCQLQLRELIDLGPFRVTVLESVLLVVAQLLEALLGHPLDAARFELPYPAPAWSDRYHALFHGQLVFDAPCLAIHLPLALLATPSMTADARAYTQARRECELALAQAGQRAPDAQALVRARLQACESSYPACAAMAAELHMSARTLIRKLGQCGSSYQALLDEARKERCLWFLQHSDYPLEQIAERLGYRDTSNFSRCVRRWFGMAPGALRAAARQGDPAAGASRLGAIALP